MKLVIYPALDEASVTELERAAAEIGGEIEVIHATDEAEARRAIADADAFYGNLTPDLLAHAPKLRWVQAPVAGLENYLFPALVESDVTLTNMSGIYSDQIADQALAYILMFARGLHIYLRRQLAHQWQAGVPVVHLADQTLGVVGLGGIGTEVAKRGAALGMKVIAVEARRRPPLPFVHALWPPERLDDLLAAADFLVLCVPHTPETVKLIRRAQLRRMKPTAYLINISRGIVVDLADLTAALQAGEIAGAGLDVFEIEPLPADHPLWDMENVIITPHMAAASPHVAPRRLGVVKENLRRFAKGEPLHNVVDKRRWF
ncbi:MAG TPA: D-2-hydroxyacid dehydrogenase [Caldilineaceae bacterium]|nr:D-2-hydroxyacid dehydrogenase [Caldilineaceae bacterium]